MAPKLSSVNVFKTALEDAVKAALEEINLYEAARQAKRLREQEMWNMEGEFARVNTSIAEVKELIRETPDGEAKKVLEQAYELKRDTLLTEMFDEWWRKFNEYPAFLPKYSRVAAWYGDNYGVELFEDELLVPEPTVEDNRALVAETIKETVILAAKGKRAPKPKKVVVVDEEEVIAKPKSKNKPRTRKAATIEAGEDLSDLTLEQRYERI